MFKNISIPPFYSLVEKGNVFLLLKEKYKDFLLQQGIEDIKTFFKKNLQSANYLSGRIPHPSIPIKNNERMVIRQYSHGGWLQPINRDLYLFGSRSFQELTLTEEIRSCDIPTIQPIGAIHQLVFPPFYKAYFLSLEIPDAKDLVQYFWEIGAGSSRENTVFKRKIIRSAGLLLREFHQSGFFHGDLQLKNILVAGDQLFLIDFDRSFRKRTLSIRERMKNLLRLNRSVEKWKRLGLPMTQTDRWRFFLAYSGEDETIHKAMKKAIQTYSIRHLFYRCGWMFEKIVRSS